MTGPPRPAAMPDLVAPPRLTPGQEAAVARVGCAVTEADSPARGPVVLLCGPIGVGTTTVLHALAAALSGSRSVAMQTAVDWAGQLGQADDLPEVVIADDAHEASCGDLLRLVTAVRGRRPRGRLVLAGEGRLLSIVARDVRIEQAVGMRAILRPFTLAETRDVVAGILPPSAATAAGPEVPEAVRRIHEIAAGMPGVVTRIAGQAAVLADSRPGRQLTPADIELVHGRLSLSAA
jgi:type II secretory pathway predicted ATPase ExeA